MSDANRSLGGVSTQTPSPHCLHLQPRADPHPKPWLPNPDLNPLRTQSALPAFLNPDPAFPSPIPSPACPHKLSPSPALCPLQSASSCPFILTLLVRLSPPCPLAHPEWSTPSPRPCPDGAPLTPGPAPPGRAPLPCPAPGPRSPLAAVRSCEQPPRGYQHCATVELVVLKHQRGLPRLRVRRAVRPVDDAAATAVVLPGVLCSPRPEGLGARRGAAGGRGAVAGSNVVCKCRL